MSRTKKNSQPTKPKFDTRPYERPGLAEADILDIKDAFDMFDRQHLGSINPKDLKNALSSLGPEAKAEPVYQLIINYASQGAGNITFEQFIHLMTPRLLPDDTRENIDNIFALFDTQKTGYISAKDLRKVAYELGQDVNEDDIRDMILRADADSDGLISKDEFFDLLSARVRQ